MIVRVLLVLLATAMPALGQPAPVPPTGDAVALLPLDAEARLELYGQPVASEIARALVAGGIDVVVVGPKMAVPERVKLIVDGTIKNKGDAVVLAIRVRNRADGRVLQPLESTAQSLSTIDKAAADLASRVLPIVRDGLAALRRSNGNHGTVIEVPKVPPAPRLQPMLVAITGQGPSSELLRLALVVEVDPWARANQREPTPIDGAKLAKKVATKTVAESGIDHGLLFEVLGYDVELGPVPLARARVRVRIASAGTIQFDRVIVTDTIVGDRGMTSQALGGRVASELLAILRPHIRRAVPAWR
jgi:hypothetical protein